ncbi:MAG: SufD family Fe-S cluster assembly protein [Hyphomicrobiales bacterium]|nr:SufD family Fe-S cluster assembly protein [Hyphomicrobiales bacterium]
MPRSTAEAALVKQFEEGGGFGSSPRRRAAFACFSERGLPTRRVEFWHYTDLRGAMSNAAPLSPDPDDRAIESARKLLAGRDRAALARIVLINGRFIPQLSDDPPSGMTIGLREPETVDLDDPMAELNAAMTLQACVLSVGEGQQIQAPIEIVHLAAGEGALSLYSQVAVSLGRDASASFLETFLGAGSGAQRNVSTELKLGRGARARHVVAVEDDPALHIESQTATLAARAALDAFAIVAGGALTRRQILHRLQGEDATVCLAGLTLVNGGRRADTSLQVVHSAPAGTSREFYRALVDDQAIGTFQGKVVVESAAHKTEGAMKSQAILLSPEAQMNAKPELEIFADDVVCGHGATAGSLDPEQIFYLGSRGIPKSVAESMLLEAFGEEAISRVRDETLASAVRRRFRAWLDWKRDRNVATMEGVS